jgi:very-short-patch-repair endonuclease
MEYTLLIVAIVIILMLMKAFLDRRQQPEVKQPAVYHYGAKSSLMTPSEVEFFKMLTEAVGDRYYIFPQVQLSALLDERTIRQNYKAARWHINQKSVDYVLCDKVALKLAYVVELDDGSHERVDRQERDKEVERIFRSASIPLARFSNYEKLKLEDISSGLSDVFRHP